jgi:hypothetical protein
MQIHALSFYWYPSEDDFKKMKLHAEDSAKLHATYAEWLAAAEYGFKQMQSRGNQQIIKIKVSTNDFLAWCKADNRNINAASRNEFSHHKLSFLVQEGKIILKESPANVDIEFETLFAEANAGVLQHVRHATDLVEQHVTPILTLKNLRQVIFEGSGFFAQLNNRYYLVTAAHVLDACENGVYLPALMEKSGQSLSLDGVVTGRKPGQTRDDDRFDVGFIRLNDHEVEQIGIQCFVDLNTINDPLPVEGFVLMIALGYPSREQVVDAKAKSITPNLTMFMTGIAEEKGYRLAKVDPRSHLLLKSRPEDISYNGKTSGAPPRFNGMSGGGVWMVSIHNDYSLEAPPPFAAMVVERPASYKPSILATRAPLIRHFIRRFDDSI